MNNEENIKMVISCAQGLLDSKELEYSTYIDLRWHGAEDHNLLQIVKNIFNGVKYRVKPEPKTVRVRMYWIKDSDKPRLAVDVNFDMVQSSPMFHSWEGDEQLLTVPEE